MRASADQAWKDYKASNWKSPRQSEPLRAQSEAERSEPTRAASYTSPKPTSQERKLYPGDYEEWKARQYEQFMAPLGRHRSPKRRLETPRSRSRGSRFQNPQAGAKFENIWSFKSKQRSIDRDEHMDILRRMWKKYGNIRKWDLDASIFHLEGIKFRKQIQARGWTKNHIPSWCEHAQADRAKDSGGQKMPAKRILSGHYIKEAIKDGG